MSSEVPRLRDLRQQQERAQDWLIYTSWVAMVYAAVNAIATFTSPLDADGFGTRSIVFLGSALLQGVLGFWIRSASMYAAWGLVIIYAMEVSYAVSTVGLRFGAIWAGAVGLMYIRGAVASVSYHDLEDTIKQRSADDLTAEQQDAS